MRLHPVRPALLLATVAAVTLTSALPTLAQTAEEKTTFLGRITLFADRLGRSLNDVQGHISVVDDAELKQRNVQTLEDLLRYIPGVTAVRQVSGADPFGGQTGIRIRGVEGNRIQMVVDGGRIPERIIDGSRDYLDFGFTKQVDVVRGPASVLWGADALGGVVAVQTIDPEDLLAGRDRGGQVTLGYGEITDATNVALAFAQRFGSDVSLLVARSRGIDHEMKLTNADPAGGQWGCTRAVIYGAVNCGEFNPLTRTSDRTLVKLVWEVADNQSLKLTFDHLDRLSEIDNTLTRSATVFANPRERDIFRTRYAAEYTATFGGAIDEVKATLAWTPSGYDQHALSVANTAGVITRTHDYVNYAEDFLELDVQATSRFTLGSSEHVLTFGLNSDRAETSYDRTRRVVDTTAGMDVWTVPSGFNFTDGATTRANLYVQDQITLLGGKLELTPGLRYATYEMAPTANASVVAHPDNPTTDRAKEALLASMGATWRFNDTYSVWAHYGEGFKMPTFQQLFTSSTSGSFDLVPAPWLVPEEVKSIEIGFRGEYDKGFFAVNAFQAKYKNFIESFWFVPGTNDISYRNIAEVETWGVELEAGWDATDRLRLTGSVAWMDGKAMATPGAASTQHLVPPLTAVLGASYELTDMGLTLNASATLVEDMQTVNAANFTPPGYGVLDVGASWNFAENAVLNLTVNNVFDKKYYEMGAASSALASTAATTNTVPPQLFTGPGRSVALNLDYRF
ncbi:MAG: TonB-dependent hemoglobin/transferrin/lactoferrin family receptor [Pseudotabrizicola sp.]|uniref:TonB-dependent hemoglobin/transferrin/lactoferrin family receptor n=1 Tax=Pseudotabrizicola sp. TaxID=2939647 RepID=UPI002720B82A|nr:TonB-dependent hemoglobin/transferrin/lactoferrin family receptor [Pseudotabrizicola sp.]MDO9641002.1 TonB-dependent hemoglobin/transferrin/lactoferrin family receptor [Pseudotabrizicola sp.]